MSLENSYGAKFRYETSDLLVFSRLQWDFVVQRPQHLLSRFAKFRRVFFIEEPVFECHGEPELRVNRDRTGVNVVVPRLPSRLKTEGAEVCLESLLQEFVEAENVEDYTSWYDTPMAMEFSRRLNPVVTVYDCMDELSHFCADPSIWMRNEAELMAKADLVFVGGRSLYEAKKHLHGNIFAFPGGIDISHFARARKAVIDPPDQAAIPRPRLGHFGVIDERIDLELIARAACLRPDWNWVMIGPLSKVEQSELPIEKNIFYLGKKDYEKLPEYVAGWDAAVMPFVHGEVTRFISPTETPECLAAGRSVVSTSISDVVDPYGHERLVRIADSPEKFVEALEAAMLETRSAGRLARIDRFLAARSWDETWRRMALLEAEARRRREFPRARRVSWRETAGPSVQRSL